MKELREHERKTASTEGPNTGGPQLYHGWRGAYSRPRHCNLRKNEYQGQRARKAVLTIKSKDLETHSEGLHQDYKFTEYLLSTYYRPKIILGVKNIAENTSKSL